MIRLRLALLSGLLWVIAAPATLQAQDARYRWPLSVEMNLGLARGWTSGEYRGGVGILLDALVAYRLNDDRPVVVALAFGGQPGAAYDDICKLPASGVGCIPTWPFFRTIGPLAGWESDTRALRGLTGPVFVNAGGATAGWQARLDGFIPFFRRISLSGTVQLTAVPYYSQETFAILGLGVGLRFR